MRREERVLEERYNDQQRERRAEYACAFPDRAELA
jgi:hypothetical protein